MRCIQANAVQQDHLQLYGSHVFCVNVLVLVGVIMLQLA